jgi:hypothetical protein
MAYGGPASLEEIPGYLADIRSGRPTPRAVLDEITESYRAIGGGSPLLEISRRQVAALSARLGGGYRCYLGMRHWAPWIEDVVGDMVEDGVTHAVSLVLAIVFGRTLVGERESLCTRFARLVHTTLPPEVERYSRKVTAAWTIFFAALFLLSCALYLGGFLAAWSLLANILTPILMATMFVVEYAVRHRVLPGWERVGVLGGIRAFSRHFG